MILGHRIQLEPTSAQANFFARAAGTARFTWNWSLNEINEHYKATGKFLRPGLLKKEKWNKTKPDWVYESPKDANQEPFSDLAHAWNLFFKSRKEVAAWRKRGCKGTKPHQWERPTFKKKSGFDSFYLSNDKASISGNRLRVPLLGWVRMTEELRFSGRVMGYRITREADRWFVSVSVEVGDIDKARTGDSIVGVDLGITPAVALSTGEQFHAPKPLKKSLTKLARLQRSMSRRVKGSARRHAARMQVARLHARIGNIRRDWLHKLTTNLCRENQTVVIENLNIAGMVQNRKLALAILEIGWGEFKRQLKYKAPMYGTMVLMADRWFPSSKLCSECGHLLDELSLSVREWVCPECGCVHDRNVNAAKNLSTLGLRGIYARGQKGSTDYKSWSATRLDEPRSSTVSTCAHVE